MKKPNDWLYFFIGVAFLFMSIMWAVVCFIRYSVVDSIPLQVVTTICFMAIINALAAAGHFVMAYQRKDDEK